MDEKESKWAHVSKVCGYLESNGKLQQWGDCCRHAKMLADGSMTRRTFNTLWGAVDGLRYTPLHPHALEDGDIGVCEWLEYDNVGGKVAAYRAVMQKAGGTLRLTGMRINDVNNPPGYVFTDQDLEMAISAWEKAWYAPPFFVNGVEKCPHAPLYLLGGE